MKLTTALILMISSVFSLAEDSSRHHDHRLRHDDNHNRSLSEGRKCGYVAPSPEKRKVIDAQITEYKSKTSHLPRADTISINVYWHVFYNSGGDGNIDDAAISKSIDVLNDAFSGAQSDYSECSASGQSFVYGSAPVTPFTFVLADTTRTESDSYFDLDSDASESQRASMRVGTCADLNIFSGNCEALGWTNLASDCPNGSPETPNYWDTLMLRYTTVPEGGLSRYEEGDTLVHEVGHWLGLEHTFEGGCSGDGDSVSDTPAEETEATGCPIGRDTCSGEGVDPIHNYMDYTDDCCLYLFTDGQIERMINHAGAYRGLGSGTVDDDGSGGGGDDDNDNDDDCDKTSIYKYFLKKLQ